MITETEMQLVSASRILVHADFILPEDQQQEIQMLPPNWPTQGNIKFSNLTVKYSPVQKAALNQLTLEIKQGQKIGIVGQSGAGKSTIALSLFRVVEPSSGLIKIDDVNISKVGLSILRKNLAIVPQESVLFNTTLRKNLDPFSSYTDQEILQHLKLVELDYIAQNLNTPIHAILPTLSSGHKQLLCLVRALLRQPSILVLEEATASLDAQTTRLIQGVLKQINCTVIVITHCLDLAMNCDKVLVLEGGDVVEYDHPQSLLMDPHGKFF